MKLDDAAGGGSRHPGAFAAVCVMTVSLTLLLFGLSIVPPVMLVPGYAAAYLIIAFCIFGPQGKVPRLRQTMAFLVPGVALLAVALLDLGLWAGGWLLGLPAWGILLSHWTPRNAFKAGRLLTFFGLLALGLVAFTINIVYPILSLVLFLLPVIPLIWLAHPIPAYRVGLLQTVSEVFLGLTTVVAAFIIPTPDGSWSLPWSSAGGAAAVGLLTTRWAWGFKRSRPLQPIAALPE